MLKWFILLAWLFSINFHSYATEESALKKVLIGYIELGSSLSKLAPIKIEAAMNLATRLSERYYLIPFDYRDSVAKLIETKGIEPTIYNLSRELEVDEALMLRVNKFVNLLRVDIWGFRLADSSIASGKGFANIRYFIKENNQPIIDPSLLAACQRAFADYLDEPDLYQNLEGSFRLRPAPLLVVGNIYYIETDSAKKYNIFRQKQSSSFFAIEKIFEVARKSFDFVTIDTETRDSIYAFHNFYEPENYSQPTPEELKALLDFEVEYYISGELNYFPSVFSLKLYLCRLSEEGLEIVSEIEETFDKDSLDMYETALIKGTKRLLNINTE
ncbi:MAG: hypothetical protein N2517_05245 [Ignavibacteria bacterium]|nr:hypothetical protein [Ignavibacteria bacterium]